MPDASPAKWHLAHTTWFFEHMIVEPNLRGYRPFDAQFGFLFNSYYDTAGPRQPRPRRGMLTRPALPEILDYRRHVDAAIHHLLEHNPSPELLRLIELGRHHEQQHQELLLADILHLFAQSPLRPTYLAADLAPPSPPPEAAAYRAFPGGIVEIGSSDDSFAFDSERPRHKVYLEPFSLADRAITNAEWLEFIADGGYENPLLWLSQGWAKARSEGWSAPLYWEACDEGWRTMTLHGSQALVAAAPVTHVSYYEADAFARWAGRRLPTEAEWEFAASAAGPASGFVDRGRLWPSPATNERGSLRQMFGDVWEWTQSAFAPYPRFHPANGAIGEYNAKFMAGQFVLKGGSCATPADHIRASYRNFFPPDARWQFSGLRLAEDA